MIDWCIGEKMIRDPMLLENIRVKGFEPLTFSKEKPERKKKIRDALKNEIKKRYNLSDIKEKCRDKKIFIRVRFNLWNGSTQTKRADKDLDNLLKLLLDSLCEHIDNTEKVHGLGIITSDLNIFQILADKKLVSTEAEEGFEIEMFEYFET